MTAEPSFEAELALASVRELATKYRGKLTVYSVRHLFRLVFACLPGRSIDSLPFTKIAVIVRELFGIRVENRELPYLLTVYLAGPYPEGSTQVLDGDSVLTRIETATAKPVICRDDARLAEVRSLFEPAALTALAKAVELLERLTPEELVSLSYSAVLDRPAIGGQNILPRETSRDIVVASVARNVRNIEKSGARRTAAFLLPDAQLKVDEARLHVDVPAVCLKTGTTNAALAMFAIALLAARGIPPTMGLLLLALSADQSAEHRNAAKSSRLRGEAVHDAGRKAEVEQTRERLVKIEEARMPGIQAVVKRLEELGLVTRNGEAIFPTCSRIELVPRGEIVDLAEMTRRAEEVIHQLGQRWLSESKKPRTGTIRFPQRPLEGGAPDSSTGFAAQPGPPD